MKCIISKAKRKGELRAEADGIAGDVRRAVKVCDGSFPLKAVPVESMIERYDKGELEKDQFKYAELYRAALNVMTRGTMPEIGREDLKRLETELLRYSCNV